MAYVPNYNHDIFVSYAHVDDEPMPGIKDGWVTNLVNSIRTRLTQGLGRNDSYSLWMDYKISHNVGITPQIMDAVSNSAILLIIMSPGYIASDWCKKENSKFLELVRETESRVFIVEREPVERSSPDSFCDLKAFIFWIRNKPEGAPHILGHPEPKKDDREYYSLVDDIAYEVVKQLKKLKEGTIVTPIYPSIFLAQVTDDLEQQRNDVKRYLNQAGINVLPDILYSQEPENFKKSTERDLMKCAVFVQLLSEVAGKKPPDLPEGYVKRQLDMAKDMKMPIFQWRSTSVRLEAISDAEHRKIVDGASVRAEGIEDFKGKIKNVISEKAREKEKPIEKKPGSALVFVNMESSDRALADKVGAVLQKKGLGFCMPLFTGEPSEVRKVLKTNLKNCNGIIIIYGCSTASWVQCQIMESRKILLEHDKSLQAFAVFEGPPEEKCEIPIKLPNLKVLNFRKGVDEEVLEKELASFIESLKEGL